MNKQCVTCQYGSYDEMQGYVCVNDESKYVTDFVESNHACADYVPNKCE